MAASPFDSDSNYNVTITAESGSGKSFLVNEMVAHLRATGGIVRMIDVGYSYINLCAELGGQFLDFGKATNICINPFPAVINYDDEGAELLAILSIMAAPKSGLTDFQTAALGRVLREEYGRHRHLLPIDHIAQRCASIDDLRIRDLATQLSAFTSKGPYGRYFNGPATLDLTNPLIVLELDGLKSQPTLQRIVLLILMYQINQQMFGGDISIQKGLFRDEAWDLLGIPDVAAFTVNLYRRVRKANGFITTVTQCVSDDYLNEGTIAIVENSANKYVLKQPGQDPARHHEEDRRWRRLVDAGDDRRSRRARGDRRGSEGQSPGGERRPRAPQAAASRPSVTASAPSPGIRNSALVEPGSMASLAGFSPKS